MAAMTCALVEQLQTLADPRRQCANLKHPLVDVMMLGFCGVLAGCEDFVEIATWATEHQAVLGTFLDLPHGIPSHDTFTQVFAVLPPATLQAVLLPWLGERRGLPGEFIHLDGKTLRGTRCKSQKLKALQVVSAWAGRTGLTLVQVTVATKANEITALPELLKLLDLQDKIVTIDAVGCQTDLAAAIVEGGGDYMLAVKGENTGGGDGVTGVSNVGNGNGVHGTNATGFGVLGESTDGRGVVARSDTNYGLRAASQTSAGIRGSSVEGRGIEGWATSSEGVVGISTTGNGVWGQTEGAGTGVLGTSNTGAGVAGRSQTTFAWPMPIAPKTSI